MQVLFAWLTPSAPDLLIIAAVMMLLFGNRLPNVMRSLGRSVVEFKKGINGIENDINDAVRNADEKAKPKSEGESHA